MREIQGGVFQSRRWCEAFHDAAVASGACEVGRGWKRSCARERLGGGKRVLERAEGGIGREGEGVR
eukprot:488826-Pleurochrysis_carterae.AAC.2